VADQCAINANDNAFVASLRAQHAKSMMKMKGIMDSLIMDDIVVYVEYFIGNANTE
jgi:hypothetical protein